MTSKPIFDAIDAGHVGTDWDGHTGTPSRCAKDGEKWPCEAIATARQVAGPVLSNGKSVKTKIMDTPTMAPPKIGKK